MRRLLALLAAAVVAAPAVAVPRQAPDETARVQADLREEQVRLRRFAEEARAAEAEVQRLDRVLTGLAEPGEDRRIAAQRDRLDELSRREAQLAVEAAAARGPQGRLLSALQMMSRRPPPPLLIPADQAVDTVRASILMRAIAPELRRRTDQLAHQATELDRVRRLAALSSEALFVAESGRSDRRARTEAERRRQVALHGVLTAQVAASTRAVDTLSVRLAALGAPALALVEEAVSAPRPAGGRALRPPVAAEPDRRFGSGSTGWTWRGLESEARAPAAARVSYAGELTGWGRIVVLDLGPGWRAVLAGLSETSVESGAQVEPGQLLGRVSAAGELHFELRRDERPVDPAPFLQ